LFVVFQHAEKKPVAQRGRKSAAALATVSALPLRTIEPPADLSPEEATVWARVAATKPHGWWDAGSAPLLAQYCRVAVQADLLADLVRAVSEALRTDPDELKRYTELRKLQAAASAEMSTLATKMRLTQQSHYRADKSRDPGNGKTNKPWHNPPAVYEN
jgi:hypothetical protein